MFDSWNESPSEFLTYLSWYVNAIGDDIRWRHSLTAFGDRTGTCKEASIYANTPCLALALCTMNWICSKTLESNSSARPNKANASLNDCNSQSVRGLPGLRYSIRGVKELYSKRTCRSGSSGLDRRIWPNNFSLRFNQIWENRWIDKWCVSRKTSSTLWFG